jgi:ATP adenylyltransferase
VGTVEELDDALNDALFRLLRDAMQRLRRAVHCEGMNVGINQGACAGASLREHLHVQIVPRWEGDNNFMPVTASTRVIPQALDDTLSTLIPFFADL